MDHTKIRHRTPIINDDPLNNNIVEDNNIRTESGSFRDDSEIWESVKLEDQHRHNYTATTAVVSQQPVTTNNNTKKTTNLHRTTTATGRRNYRYIYLLICLSFFLGLQIGGYERDISNKNELSWETETAMTAGERDRRITKSELRGEAKTTTKTAGERDISIIKSELRGEAKTITKTTAVDNYQRPCRVLIRNEVDFHHEVIESAVLRFRLPWHEFNCTVSKPIIYDFALYQNNFTTGNNAFKTALSIGANDITGTEFWGWKQYYEKDLRYRTFDRKEEGLTVPTKAYFNNLVLYKNLKMSAFDAYINISCFGIFWLKKDKKNYCVLHEAHNDTLPYWPEGYKRSCFLSPMWPEDQCKFTAADLPKFDHESNIYNGKKETRICAQGGSRNMTLAFEIFSKIPYEKYNVNLHVSGRGANIFEDDMARFGVQDHVVVTSERDYVKYHNMLSRCDIVLSFTDPINRPTHYPWGEKRSSGIIPSLVAYQIPVVLHKEFAKIYKDVLTAPMEMYTDTTESKIRALNRMILRVRNAKEYVFA